MKTSVLVSHKGWFLFCPVLWSEEEQMAIPRCGGWLLFDIALEIQQFRNWTLSYFGIEGGFPFRLQPLPYPKIVTV